jgi:DNA-binding LytR/AlgR family response regulator
MNRQAASLLPESTGRRGLEIVESPAREERAGVWQAGPPERVAARRKGNIVVLEVADVWAFEARERLCFVHAASGRFDVDLSLQQLIEELGPGFVRSHRSWVANVANVREYRSEHGCHTLLVGRLGGTAPGDAIEVPVSREYAMPIRARLLAGTVGFRSRRRSE